MKNLIVMCAPSGAGKSHWIKQNLAKINGYVCVESRDQVRFLLVKEDEPYFSKEVEVFNTWVRNIKDDLTTDGVETVIADATHLTPISRRKLFNALGASLNGVKVTAMVISGSLEDCLAHNELRKGTRGYVNKEVINKLYHVFEMPTMAEGFDEIYVYTGKGYTEIIEV